jgi:hypothetical protein
MASATAGLRWVAITGFSHGQPLNVKWANSSTPAMVLGNTNAFSEVNNQNLNAGSSASSDFVLTADNGTASTHYVDLGINGSAGGAAPFTTANGAYLYTTDNQLDISAQGASGLINLSVGATPTILAAFDVTNGITFNDKTTPSKQLRLSLSGQTASTILTLNTGAQTASRQLSVPVLAANDTVAVIGQAQTFAGIQTLSDTTDATSTTAAALVVSGGIGVAKNVTIGGTADPFARTNTRALSINSSGSAGIHVNAAAANTAEANWGVAGTRYGNLVCNTTQFNFNTGSNAVLGFGYNFVLQWTLDGASLTGSQTTDSTSITTGALITAGGIGVAKRLTLDGATGKTIKYVNGTANAAVAVTFGAVGPTGSTAGNPQGWLRVDIAGTDRYIPYW